MLGDIIKVTPSSKMVGDMAIFMVANGLTPENIYEKGKNLDYPDSVISFFKGMMGQPEGGFNEKLQKYVLKDEKPITKRAGLYIDPFDFEKRQKRFRRQIQNGIRRKRHRITRTLSKSIRRIHRLQKNKRQLHLHGHTDILRRNKRKRNKSKFQ